jgi:hypothetical protein
MRLVYGMAAEMPKASLPPCPYDATYRNSAELSTVHRLPFDFLYICDIISTGFCTPQPTKEMYHV